LKTTLPTTAAQAAPPTFLPPGDPLRVEALSVFRVSRDKHVARLRQAQQQGDTFTAHDAGVKLARRLAQIAALNGM